VKLEYIVIGATAIGGIILYLYLKWKLNNINL